MVSRCCCCGCQNNDLSLLFKRELEEMQRLKKIQMSAIQNIFCIHMTRVTARTKCFMKNELPTFRNLVVDLQCIF
jgi:hypothetical protein